MYIHQKALYPHTSTQFNQPSKVHFELSKDAYCSFLLCLKPKSPQFLSDTRTKIILLFLIWFFQLSQDSDFLDIKTEVRTVKSEITCIFPNTAIFPHTKFPHPSLCRFLVGVDPDFGFQNGRTNGSDINLKSPAVTLIRD